MDNFSLVSKASQIRDFKALIIVDDANVKVYPVELKVQSGSFTLSVVLSNDDTVLETTILGKVGELSSFEHGYVAIRLINALELDWRCFFNRYPATGLPSWKATYNTMPAVVLLDGEEGESWVDEDLSDLAIDVQHTMRQLLQNRLYLSDNEEGFVESFQNLAKQKEWSARLKGESSPVWARKTHALKKHTKGGSSKGVDNSLIRRVLDVVSYFLLGQDSAKIGSQFKTEYAKSQGGDYSLARGADPGNGSANYAEASQYNEADNSRLATDDGQGERKTHGLTSSGRKTHDPISERITHDQKASNKSGSGKLTLSRVDEKQRNLAIDWFGAHPTSVLEFSLEADSTVGVGFQETFRMKRMSSMTYFIWSTLDRFGEPHFLEPNGESFFKDYSGSRVEFKIFKGSRSTINPNDLMELIWADKLRPLN